MLRYTILLFCLFSALTKVISQDVLIRSNGDTITISVVEISEKYLIYHKLDFGDKLFTTPRSKLDKIIYANGDIYHFGEEFRAQSEELKEVAQRYGLLYIDNGLFAPRISTKERNISSGQVILFYQDIENERAVKLFKKGRIQNITGNIIGIPAGFFLGQQLYKTFSSSQKANTPLLVASSILSIVSITLNVQGVRKIKDSVKAYNNDVLFQLGGTENGVGMQLKF